MNDAERAYWDNSYDVLYDTWMQELLSEELLDFWGKIDTVSAVLVAITASGSAITGWALWQQEAGRAVWGVISGIAALISVLKTALQIPGRVKEQGDLRSEFLHLRLMLEAFRQDLANMDVPTARARFEALRADYQKLMDKTRPDIAMTKAWRIRVQRRLNEIMEQKGYIDE